MTLWPKDERRPILLVMGMILVSVGVSYAYTFVLHPIDDTSLTIPTEFWRWATTGVLSLIVVMLRMGYKAVTKELDKISKRMDTLGEEIHVIKENHTAFTLAVTDRLARVEAQCRVRHPAEYPED